MKTERDLNIGQLFREFRDWRDDEDEENASVEEFLADLKSYSEIFAKLIEPKGINRTSVFAKRLKTLDISTVYPLLLYVLSLREDQLPLPERNQILDDLESWLVRRLICQLTNKNYNRFFVSLLAKVKRVNFSEVPRIIREELLRSKELTASWPSDDEFKSGWLSKPIYVGSRLTEARCYFARSKKKSERPAMKLSLFLLRFQSNTCSPKRESRKLPIGNGYGPRDQGETVERLRGRLMNTMGNLTLLRAGIELFDQQRSFRGKGSGNRRRQRPSP